MSEAQVEVASTFVTLSLGSSKDRGETVEAKTPVVASLVKLLDSCPRSRLWWSTNLYADGHRTNAKWTSAAGVCVDVDHHVDGKKSPLPVSLLKEVVSQLGKLPGNIFHPTPNGLRFAFIYPDLVSEAEAHARAARGAHELVRRAVERWPALHVDWLLDPARMFWLPRAVVNRRQRDAVPVQMRSLCYEPSELGQLAGCVNVVSIRPPALRTTPYGGDYKSRVAAYCGANPRSYPKNSAPCPVCGDGASFGTLPASNGARWSCFSTDHPSTGIGVAGDGCWHGDALDLDAHEARMKPAELLKQWEEARRPAVRARAAPAVPKGREPGSDDGDGAPARFHLTDTGNAERLVARHGRDLRFCHPWKEWLVWDSSRWKRDATAEVKRRAKEAVLSMYQEAVDSDDESWRKALSGWARKCEGSKARAAMIGLADCEPGMPVMPEQLDANPWLFNVANGTVDLRTGELRQHRREDLLTKLSPVVYDGRASCPTWEKFLLEVMGGDQELVDFIQRAGGYALTGDVSAHVLFFAHGGGRNGKSTMLNVLLAALGEYGKAAAPDLLLAKKGDQIPVDQAALVGCRLAVCQEVDEGRRFAEVTLKQLTGGDRITARFMRENFFEFDPTHKIFLAANHKPRVRGTDEAIWSRIMLLPFEVTIAKNKRDGQLGKKLEAELPGILAWLVRGCLAWQAGGGGIQGLAPPARVLAATDAYREEEDQVGAWIEDCCIDSPTAFTSTKGLYGSYMAWCQRNSERPVSKKAMGARLRARGCKDGKHQEVRGWFGLLLDPAAAHAAPDTSDTSTPLFRHDGAGE